MVRAIAACATRAQPSGGKRKGKGGKLTRAQDHHVVGLVLVLLGASFVHFPMHSNFVVYSGGRVALTALGAVFLCLANMQDVKLCREDQFTIDKSEKSFLLAACTAALFGSLTAAIGGLLGFRAMGLRINIRSLWTLFIASVAWVVSSAVGLLVVDKIASTDLKRRRWFASSMNLIGSCLSATGTLLHCTAQGHGEMVGVGSSLQVSGLAMMLVAAVINSKLMTALEKESAKLNSQRNDKASLGWFSFGRRNSVASVHSAGTSYDPESDPSGEDESYDDAASDSSEDFHGHDHRRYKG